MLIYSLYYNIHNDGYTQSKSHVSINLLTYLHNESKVVNEILINECDNEHARHVSYLQSVQSAVPPKDTGGDSSYVIESQITEKTNIMHSKIQVL